MTRTSRKRACDGRAGISGAANEHATPALDAAALYRLMAWLSPSYPTGAFSYSSGIEWAIEAGDINDAATLRTWLTVMIADGSILCDAVFFAHAFRATAEGNAMALREVGELAVAFASSKERQLETTAQGRAFLEVTRAAWPSAALGGLEALAEAGIALPIVVGAACAGHGIPLAPALQCYVQAAAANLVSAGMRLIPLGQSDGQRVVAALEPVVAETVERALNTGVDDVGSAAVRADLASMRHETQHTRLFRS